MYILGIFILTLHRSYFYAFMTELMTEHMGMHGTGVRMFGIVVLCSVNILPLMYMYHSVAS